MPKGLGLDASLLPKNKQTNSYFHSNHSKKVTILLVIKSGIEIIYIHTIVLRHTKKREIV